MALLQMSAIAAIDVGSNAMRMAVAYREPDGRLRVVESVREPVRLGEDAFTRGRFSESTITQAVEAFCRFRTLLDQHQIEAYLAVGTSALREARNGAELIDAIREASNIELQAIPGEEEARLIFQAVRKAVPLDEGIAMLIDIGGGSVEVSLVEDGALVSAESYRLGTVRLLELLQAEDGRMAFQGRLQEYVGAMRRRFRREIGGHRVGRCVGTGGNLEALVALGGESPTGNIGRLSRGRLDALIDEISALSVPERIARWGLRPDRADVILPAALVLRELMAEARATEVWVPGIGLKDGMLIEIAERNGDGGVPSRAALARRAAVALGRRYGFDEAHAQVVARHAEALFEATRVLHGYGSVERMLLEVAALLHDIGLYVDAAAHHKHSAYLITASPLVGLKRPERELVAQVARYHRKSLPRSRHPAFSALAEPDRQRVCRLAGLLRVANALDVEHDGKVHGFRLELSDSVALLHLEGEGDLLLESWAVRRQRELFEQAFGRALQVEVGHG